MRLMLAAVILFAAVPQADAAGNKGQCKTRCDSTYQFCLNRATTKAAKKSCKIDHKSCKTGCR